ncbi:hypothetical protein DNU06_17250 [Putridiphycobacter roseus]|uniref:Uncharacterized protein n=1 Tax=Putridiphycobacter roseus TaxID=2219161 RepID=A0A2W1MUW4_9FLAO|nr:hypothetical protein [Putridiphycobacter roseus]PZE15597.1 hypothetical protein DNU06_17250 [Putridiphycobacter roseus]
MIKTLSSTSTILFCGLSSFANSSVSINEMRLQTEEELYAVELSYNAPENFKSNSDVYISDSYTTVFHEKSRYNDSNLLELTQVIAEEQIALDADLADALDELFYSNINSKPTKNRF